MKGKITHALSVSLSLSVFLSSCISKELKSKASPAPAVVDLLLQIEQSKGGGDPAWHERLNPDRQGRHHQSGREVTSKNGGARSSLSSLPLQPPRITECLVSDETGTIVFTARNDQVDIMKPSTTVIPRNTKIDMFIKGTMRLAVDKWGCVEVTEPASFEVKEVNNLSLVEYELLSVAE
ncbi:putative nucleic acid-binding protein [Rosa chinensis]|uniref:Putative nucleic acid-binding protein n=1 Tax=Rosa chinensis TaxID=74649 RepID=A0A2P6QF83_ROSCH|nr:putative nucleic acid-binding protein [Rosa chinensis]